MDFLTSASPVCSRPLAHEAFMGMSFRKFISGRLAFFPNASSCLPLQLIWPDVFARSGF
jgi:hypothetical protein